jgi:universal stress protein E
MAPTILVVVDPATRDEQPVIERAAWLAARTGAALELFACDYDSEVDVGRVARVWTPPPGLRDRVLATHRQRLEDLAKPLRARGLAVDVDVVWERPLGDAIVKKAAALSPWLVAKDTFHYNVVQRTLLSNTDWELIRRCPAPLWLVKPRKLADAPKIMVAVDPLHEHDKPAQLDEALLEFGSDLARSAGGELHVLHAVTMPMDLVLPLDAARSIYAEHEAAMRRFVRTHDVPPQNVHTLQGPAHECLQRVAQEQAADFLVMGAIARYGWRKLVIGSTAERALDRLACDVVIIKPPALQAVTQGG